MSGRPACRYHCSACRAHFSSLNAFDAHRAGDHGSGDRYCLEPLDDDRFAELTEHGVCAMYAEPIVDVSVWTLGVDLERARERSGGSLRRLPDSPSGQGGGVSASVHELPSRSPATLGPDRYLSRDELARHLVVSVKTIDRMVREGCPSHTFGRRLRRFRLLEVEDWLKLRRAA